MTVDKVENKVVESKDEINESEFISLKDYEDSYEIQKEYPHTIRNKKTGKVLSEFIRTGYIQVALNGKSFDKHRLIALQFIPNLDNLPYVDHINHIRTDNRIENLRWVSHKENMNNKSSFKGVTYEYVDTIPDDAMVVDEYNGHQFENYFYNENVFYFYNGIKYRKLHINESKWGYKFVNVIDTNNKGVAIYYSKFKKEHDLID